MRKSGEGEVAIKNYKRWAIIQNNSVGCTVQRTWKNFVLSDGFIEEEKRVGVEGCFAWFGYKFSKEQKATVLIMIVASKYVIYLCNGSILFNQSYFLGNLNYIKAYSPQKLPNWVFSLVSSGVNFMFFHSS